MFTNTQMHTTTTTTTTITTNNNKQEVSLKHAHTHTHTHTHTYCFSQVKIRRNFPLTSIEKIEYPLPPPTEATTFRLLFATYCMTLVAESEEEAKDWTEKIKEGEGIE